MVTLKVRRSENRFTITTGNRPLKEWAKLLGDVPTAGAIRDPFLPCLRPPTALDKLSLPTFLAHRPRATNSGDFPTER
jgi:hypothetical protein